MKISEKTIRKQLPKTIREKIKRQNKAVFIAQHLEMEIEQWCEKNGIDTTSEEYVAAKASIDDAVSAIYAATIEELYQKGKE